MLEVLKNGKRTVIVVFLALSILIVAVYMLVQAQSNKESGINEEEIQISPPRTADEIDVYITERGRSLQSKANERPDAVETALVILEYDVSAEDVVSLCERNNITLDSLVDIFFNDGNSSGGLHFTENSVASLEKKGIHSIREVMNGLIETRRNALAEMIETQEKFVESAKDEDTEEIIAARQSSKYLLVDLQESQKMLDSSGIPAYALMLEVKLSILQAVANDSIVKLVDLRDDGTRVSPGQHWDL